MRRSRGRVVQVESLADFDRRVDGRRDPARGLAGAGRRPAERGARAARAAGRRGDVPRLHVRRRRRGARRGARARWCCPTLPVAPVDLYRAAALHRRGAVRRRRRTRARSTPAPTPGPRRRGDADDALAQALHDHAIDEALDRLGPARHLVGVMGGHALHRGDAAYADAARLGHALGRAPRGRHRRRPGRDGGRQPRRLPGRLATLAGVDRRRGRCWPRSRRSGPSVDAWLRPALEVCAGGRRARTTRSGIPTWHYGHEPPNVFATGDRQVLPQRHPRGDPARGLRRRHRLPPRRRRHRPGGLPGRLRELLRRRVVGRRRWCWSAGRYWTETLPAWPLLQLAGPRPPDGGPRPPRRPRRRGRDLLGGLLIHGSASRRAR